jgi:hypothetical protein
VMRDVDRGGVEPVFLWMEVGRGLYERRDMYNFNVY